MIRRTKDGYKVINHEGKDLGGPFKSLETAKKRLRQVVLLKRKGK